MECANCKGERIQAADGKCLDCGFETTEKQQKLETAARKRPARKTATEKR